MPDIIGKTLLSQFRVDSFIAAGGMGAVYRVWDLKRNVPLAMKVLHSELAEDPSMFKHFQREGRALQKLAHPNIVPFYGLYQTMDISFMLERFVDGPTLKDILKRNKGKPLPLEDALVYIKALCAALGYAHANGVVHCDVKPGNVMIDSGGNIYLTDFGIARHAESSTTTIGAAGTSAYMPPEQILGEIVTPATDVYALGVILYEMVTGRRPFRGGDAPTDQSGATLNVRIRQEQLHSPVQDPRELMPTIPEKLAKAILTALNKKPAGRFAGTPQFFDAVCRAAGIAPESVRERILLPEFADNRDYARGQEVIRGATPPVQSLIGRSPLLIGGIVAAGLLGCVVIAVVGSILLKNRSAGPVSGLDDPFSSSQVSSLADATGLPADSRSQSTNTPDFAVQTAEVLLTQAAALPTSTNTPSTPKCPGNEIGTIQKTERSGGMFLLVCANDKIYEIGPLAQGVARVGPNKKFFIYITSYGEIYAVRVGQTNPQFLTKIKWFEMINKDDEPDMEIKFLGDHPYKLYVRENALNQDETFSIPRAITSPND